MCASKKRQKNRDILDRTFGAWHRDEPVEDTVDKIRKAFQESMLMHQKK